MRVLDPAGSGIARSDHRLRLDHRAFFLRLTSPGMRAVAGWLRPVSFLVTVLQPAGMQWARSSRWCLAVVMAARGIKTWSQKLAIAGGRLFTPALVDAL
jgi:hypothetical protein